MKAKRTVTRKKKKEFTEQQKSFITYLAEGKSEQEAANLAWNNSGYAKSRGYLQNKDLMMVKDAVKFAMQTEFQMSRNEILEGIKESVDLAMRMDDPNTAIRGWVELAKLLDYYKPEKKLVEHTGTVELQVLPSEVLAARANHKHAITLDESQWEKVQAPTKEEEKNEDMSEMPPKQG